VNLLGVVLGGRYEILEKLGAGGMAVVYRAVDTLLQRPVTVKVLRSELAGDEAVVKRFRREAQSAASLSHPNVVGVYDVGRQDDVHYIVMEYVEGKSLKDIIAERGPLPAEEALRIARQICEALRHAHGHHIIHRDVKPHNVLITAEGRAKVTDFGIAGAATTSTVTYPGVLLGTVYYFSPEQAQGKYGDERSDLYALGVVLYEMLTGRVPFEGESPVSVALKQIREEPRPPRELNPRVPPAAERVVLRAMAKAPELRYQSAAEMLKDLDSLQRQLAEWRSGRVALRGQPDLAERTQVVGEAAAGPTAGPSPLEGRPRTGTQPGLRDDETVGERLRTDEPPLRPRRPRIRLSRPAAWGISLAVFFGLVGVGLFLLVQWFEVPEVTVPNVVGLGVIEAETKLREHRLNARIVAWDYNAEVPNGQVFDQDPDAGSTVKAERTVSLWVSKGPELIAEVPNVIGLTWREAKISLETAGLVVDEADFTYANSETVAKDRVLSQDPAPGTRNLPRGTKAYLVVSLGSQAGTVIVPNFVGQKLDEALALLPGLGLTEGAVTRVTSQQPDRTILEQSPVPGSAVPVGSAVSFTVAGTGGSDSGGGGAEHVSTISFTVPPGPPVQNVRIVVTDNQGQRTVYDHGHVPGSEGRVSVTWTGDLLRVQIYIDGVLKEDYPITG